MTGLGAFLKPRDGRAAPAPAFFCLRISSWRNRLQLFRLSSLILPSGLAAACERAIREMARSGSHVNQEAIAMQEIHNPKRESSRPFGGLKEFVAHVSGRGDSGECGEVSPQVPERTFEKHEEVSSDE